MANALNLKDNLAIQCSNLIAWRDVLLLLGKNGYKWHGGEPMDDKGMFHFWTCFKGETTIVPVSGGLSTKECWQGFGFNVVQAEDFINKYSN